MGSCGMARSDRMERIPIDVTTSTDVEIARLAAAIVRFQDRRQQRMDEIEQQKYKLRQKRRMAAKKALSNTAK